MQNAGAIFLGNTPGPARSYLGGLLASLRKRYRRLIIPCCGKFAIAEVAVNVGWSPDRIDCSDVSLFSSILGYLASGQPLSALHVTVTPPPHLEPTLSPLAMESAGEILYAVKMLAADHHAKTYWDELVVRELQRHRDRHVRDLDQQAHALAARLTGLRYRALDMWEHMAEVKDDGKAITYVNPPGYERGYSRLYDTGGAVEWKEPRFEEFSPKTQHPELRDALTDFAGLAIFYRYQAIEADETPLVIFGSEYSLERTDYLLSNRPDLIAEVFTPGASAFMPMGVRPSPYPVFGDDDQVTAESQLRFVSCPLQVALYYRDLWAHRLATTNAEENYLVLLDGKVFSVLGMVYRKFFGADIGPAVNYVFERYGFSVPHARYQLNKLLMMALVSTAFRDQVIGSQGQFALRTPTGVRTVCLSRYPEIKINRGVMKLLERKQWRSGEMFHLTYQADFKEMSFQEVIEAWLEWQSRRPPKPAESERKSPTSAKT